MLRKIFLISLILILPVQVWAGLDMSFKHQAVVVDVEAKEISHNCHQDGVASNEDGVKLNSQSESGGCYACALCVGVGFVPTYTSINQPAFSTVFRSAKASFDSSDVSSLIKPPIL